MPAKHDTYCVSADRHLVRLANNSEGVTSIYNNFETFGPKALAKEITLKRADILRGKLHVKSISTWTPDDATFVPLPKSASFPLRMDYNPHVSGAVIAGSRISGDVPIYPSSAKSHNISGSVVLVAAISRTGTIEDIEVISAPSTDLARAATDAVKTWKYVPYLLDGQTVEVDTDITVNFNIGGI